jgi:hypothetical protein
VGLEREEVVFSSSGRGQPETPLNMKRVKVFLADKSIAETEERGEERLCIKYYKMNPHPKSLTLSRKRLQRTQK